jgi:uncharacterized protein (TIGR00730 family)
MNEKNKEELKDLTLEHLHCGYVPISGDADEEDTLHMIQDEFRSGIDAMKGLEKSVTFYGGARFDENHEVYKKVRKLAYRIAKELDCTIISGGGSGVMEAACRGASEAGGKTIGLTIKLPRQQKVNRYVSQEIPFYFFFARQVSLSYTTEVCIFCPGGFGTLNELFEMFTLKQTGKIGKVPVILFDSEYWNPLQKIIKENLLEKYKTINPADLDIYTITDNEDEILEIIKNSKIRNGEDVLK